MFPDVCQLSWCNVSWCLHTLPPLKKTFAHNPQFQKFLEISLAIGLLLKTKHAIFYISRTMLWIFMFIPYFLYTVDFYYQEISFIWNFQIFLLIVKIIYGEKFVFQVFFRLTWRNRKKHVWRLHIFSSDFFMSIEIFLYFFCILLCQSDFFK